MIIIKDCIYCNYLSTGKYLYSTLEWMSGSYCSKECLISDILRHKSYIDFFDIEKKNLYKEDNSTNKEFVDSIKKQLILEQKLLLLESLLENDKLNYNDNI